MKEERLGARRDSHRSTSCVQWQVRSRRPQDLGPATTSPATAHRHLVDRPTRTRESCPFRDKTRDPAFLFRSIPHTSQKSCLGSCGAYSATSILASGEILQHRTTMYSSRDALSPKHQQDDQRRGYEPDFHSSTLHYIRRR